jgi:hypothetical protein
MSTRRLASRDALIAELRSRITNDLFPRLTIVVVLALCGATAFLTSYVLLTVGVDTMALRYGVAVVGGYAMFLLLIRGWIRVHQPRFVEDANHDLLYEVVDGVTDVAVRGTSHTGGLVRPFAAGRSGGGGGGGSWEAQLQPLRGGSSSGSDPSGWLPDVDVDLDELWWLVLAIVLAFGALIAVGFVVYSAPVLLAEVALDAAIVAPVYRRLRREDSRHWAGTVLRRTWVPALVVVIFVAGAGYALQQAAPEARSIGGVWRSLVR